MLLNGIWIFFMKGGRMTKEEVRKALVVVQIAGQNLQDYADSLYPALGEDEEMYDEYNEYSDRIRNSVDEIADVIRNVTSKSLKGA